MLKKKLVCLIICLFLIITNSACVHKKIVNGQLPDKDLVKILKVGIDKKKNILQMLGHPTFTGQFNDNSFYYAEIESNQIAFLEPDVLTQKILQLEFDNKNTLKNVYFFNQDDSEKIKFSSNETKTYGNKIGFLQQIFSNMGMPGLGRGTILGSGRADD